MKVKALKDYFDHTKFKTITAGTVVEMDEARFAQLEERLKAWKGPFLEKVKERKPKEG